MKTNLQIASIYFFILCFVLTSCAKIDKQKLINEIKTTDIEFSNLSKKEGMHTAFLEYIAEDGVMLRPNSNPIVGKDHVRDMFDLGNDSSFQLTWEPQFADVSESGDLGYTYGIYTLALNDTTMFGTYVSVWKNFNGQWKWVLDSGNEGISNEAN